MISPRIQQLSTVVANQIAAGEVIERPASVVKELLENCADAGSECIHIDIEFGGLNLIKISDNGSGIYAEDLPLAIAAHATSKIKELKDLFAINSMGFRGEALASIASVSRLAISSKPAHQDHAMMLRVDGGMIASPEPCARAQGTTIEVMDLFFNAPVRKRFLKSARSEFQAIEAVVKRFALSEPTITLILRHDSKDVLTLMGAHCEQTRAMRIRKILGNPFVDQAVPIDIELAGMHLQGWTSTQTYQRSQNDKQWIYVNQRMTKDKLLQHAIVRAYDSVLHPGRYPSCLLYLSIPTEEVDVNVHPTKHEVRFQQPRLVHDFIVSTIKTALTTCQPSEKEYHSLKPSRDVCEVYTPKPIHPASFEPVRSHDWHILTADVGMVFFDRKPYLIDMKRAQQECLLSALDQHPFPWASRPLLVPIRYSMTNKNAGYQTLLAPLGIDLDRIGDNEWVVRSTPLFLPQLQIKKVLEHLDDIVNSGASSLGIAQQLISYQSFDAFQLTKDETELLAAYLYEKIQASDVSVPWCLCLDNDTLQRFFREAAYQ